MIKIVFHFAFGVLFHLAFWGSEFFGMWSIAMLFFWPAYVVFWLAVYLSPIILVVGYLCAAYNNTSAHASALK